MFKERVKRKESGSDTYPCLGEGQLQVIEAEVGDGLDHARHLGGHQVLDLLAEAFQFVCGRVHLVQEGICTAQRRFKIALLSHQRNSICG